MITSGKKVLLTGGCGFIGNTMSRLLLEERVDDLLVVDKMSYVSNREFHDKEKIRVEQLDICSSEAYQLVLDYKPDIIINMAAESHVDVSISNPDVFLKTNVNGTTNLMNAALKLETVPFFVQISTDEVYGDIDEGLSKEEDPRKTSSPYSASKASAEMFVEAYGRTFNLPYLITRSSNNYGPYQHTEKFVPKAITHLLAGKRVPVYDRGLNQRDWIHVEDNCWGVLGAMANTFDTSSKRVYNIGCGQPVHNITIVKKLAFLLDVHLDDAIEFVTDRPGHDFRYALDASRLQSVCFWKPRISLDLGLAKTVEWYRARK